MPASRFFRVAHERLRAVFRKDTLDAELERELAFHFDHLVQEFVEGGLSAEEARHAARRTLGNIASLEEQCRDQRAVTWIHDLRRDLIYGIRMLRKHPAFTLVAVISLALGIGANTAIFSVMHAVLRERLPIPDDGRLVVLRTFPVDAPQQELHALLSEYFAWRDGNRSFDVMGVALGHQADFGADADGPRAERVGGQLVTADVFILLGVKPHLGRAFTEKEGRVGADDRVIVIGHRLWQRRYGGRPDIVGQVVRLDKVTWTIVGVMPDGFRYPNEDTDYWLPLRVDRSQPQGPRRFFVVTARLKPGVTPQQAQSDVGIISERLAREDPDRHAGWSVRVRPLREAMFGWSVAPLFTLQAAVALLLLVACANIAGLLLARSLVRMPEMALRSALGAGRGRIVRQLLTESVLLSAAGGVLGVLVAWVGIRGVVSMSPPPGSVGIVDIGVEPRTLVITALISIAAGMLFGLAPAVMGAGPRATAALKAPSGSAAMRFRGVLVVAQLAVTFVLLIGSGLLMKSFVQLVSRDLRFDPERLLTFEFHMPLSDYLKRQGTFEGLPYFRIDPPPSLTLERVRSAVGALPGVETVAGVSFPLINSVVLPSMAVAVDTSSGGMTSRAYEPSQGLAIGVGSLEDHVADRQLLSAAYFLVTPGFFTSIKAQLADGRDFSESDTATSRWVVIVNETAANRFWPGQRAVGRQLRLSSVPEERPREVVAVVRDIPFSRQGEIRPAVYAPYLQQPPTYPQPGANMFGRMTFMVRTTGDPMKLVPAVSHAVAGIDPDRPLSNVTTVEQQLRRVLPQRGYFAFAVTAFALVAMLLAGVGIYGVVSVPVAERTREIGIRLALGASRREVIRLVGRRALLVLALGLSLGLGGALMMTRLLQSQLWGVTPTDQTTFAAAIVLLVSAALAACVLPLRRALTVDPTVALRVE